MVRKMFFVGGSSMAMSAVLFAGAAQAGAGAQRSSGTSADGAGVQAQSQSVAGPRAETLDKTRESKDRLRPLAKPKAKAKAKVPSKADDRATDQDIIIQGVRSSMADARAEKRESDAIVDVVKAEDIGKLPNNTVGDVIASVPGISVYRTEGEVNDIQLRGLFGVQTTVGGTPIESGADRVASIADLPADLVKSVEVYKTRTPDQVEGGGAGTINIEYRKPTDFKRGLTFSTNATARYNNQSRKYNQVYTAIVNYRRDTSIGEMGIQLGATVNYNPFLESDAHNDPLTTVQTRQVVGPQILPYPTYAPSQVDFAYVTGSRTTPSFNGALQWAPDNRTSLVLEGFYAKPTFDRYSNTLYMPVLIQAGSTNNLPALSNVTLVPGTNRMASVTVSPVTQVGPIADLSTSNDSNFQYKFSGKRAGDNFNLFAELSYTGANRDYELLTFRNRFINRPTYDVDFATTKFGYPMMNLTFRDLDLLDPKQYRFAGVEETQQNYSNRTLASRIDLVLRPQSELIDSLKFGLRYTRRKVTRDVAGRSIGSLQIDPALLPGAFAQLSPIAEGFGGTRVKNNARWLTYDRDDVRQSYGDLRTFLTPYNAAFATDEPNGDQSKYYRSLERSVAFYGMARWKAKLLLPIDGVIGARVTNTIVDNSSFASSTKSVLVGSTTTTVTTVTPRTGGGNYLNIEPTVNATIHFAPRLQARLSYNIGIRRPNPDQTTPYITLDDTSLTGNGGNPDLKPEKTTRYDAILEYYFGRQGLITINPYYWQVKGAFATFETLEVAGLDPTLLYRIKRPYNAGDGYRRGIEVQAQTFFTFLPGILKNFGVAANYTYVDAKLDYNSIPDSTTVPPRSIPLVKTPKNVYNIQALFERGSLNARLSYNFNDTILDNVETVIANSRYIVPRTWMDAAINYSIRKGPLKNLGFSVQMQNVLASTRRSFYGYPDQPRDVIYMARTYGGTIRYKF